MLARRMMSGAGARLGAVPGAAIRMTRGDVSDVAKHANFGHMLPTTAFSRSAGAENRGSRRALEPRARLIGSRIAGANGARATTFFTSAPTSGRSKRALILTGEPVFQAVRSIVERVHGANWPRSNLIGDRFMSGVATIDGPALEPSAPRSRGGDRLTSIMEQAGRRSRENDHMDRRDGLAQAGPRRLWADEDRSARWIRPPGASASLRTHSRPRTIQSGGGQSGGGGGIVVNYSPNVTVNGGAGMEDIDSLLVDAMRRHGHEVAQILEREAAVRRRIEF